MECEYETTCGIIFDGSLYGPIKEVLFSRCEPTTAAAANRPVMENIDVFRDSEYTAGRYREITRRFTSLSVADETVEAETAERRWDHKKTVYVYESQIPHVERKTNGEGSVIFTTCTYKVSTERTMTSDEWNATVKEDHMTGRYARTFNKKRICFYEGAFKTVAGTRYTRVSVGEKSTYSGTLEARTTCNSVYFFEIEHETVGQLDWFAMHHAMYRLNELLFELLPYDLVRRAMAASNTCSVQRERVDNIFDTFKRNFQNYTVCRGDLRRSSERDPTTTRLDFYVMPKWDGVRAVGLYYCEGYLLVKDAHGRLASFNTRLPFDNDMVFQLEAVDTQHRDRLDFSGNIALVDSVGRYYVITELMAVLIKSQNTMFQVYGRNTIAHDTCRNIGNVVDGVSIKTQFDDPAHVCNLYRPLPADTSLRVLAALTAIKGEFNTAVGFDGIITLTAVVPVPVTAVQTLDALDGFFASDENGRRHWLAAEFSKWLPAFVQSDRRASDDCEGLILAYTLNENVRPCRKVKGAVRVAKRTKRPFDHGYFKLKRVNTVDLELDLNDGSLRSADGTTYTAIGLPSLRNIEDNGDNDNSEEEVKHIRGWAERPVPVYNRRVIVECFLDGDTLKFLRDRCDKSRPDSDSKIIATDRAIYDARARLSK